MTEAEALQKMIPPGAKRAGKWRQGVIQIWVTRACDNACFGCTQGSNLGGKPGMITLEQFDVACRSLHGYFGVVGMFGGNPAMHPEFEGLCEIMKKHFPRTQRGLWCNNPITEKNARTMRHTFNPTHSNLNVHLNPDAARMFKKGWPECHVVGLDRDSRHSPVHLAMKDLDVLPAHPGQDREYLTKMPNTEENRWNLIADCDINKHWSAMIGVFRGELRAWFCEVAGAQSMLHQDDPDYPDTGLAFTEVQYGYKNPSAWWQLPMQNFYEQVRKHCHECGVPLRGYGELAMGETGKEQTTQTHADVFKPKRKGREVEVVTELVSLDVGRIKKTVSYLENASS